MKPPSDAILSVQNLQVDLDGLPIVDGLSFDIRRGERLCLLGPSGSGKSLTASSVLGLWPASARLRGSIQINGVEVIQTRATRRPATTRVGMVFQDSLAALNPLVSIGAQMCEPFMRFHGLSRKEALAAAIELLAKMSIPEPDQVVRRTSPEVSGGQRQRICLALALACKPSLIVADEPTTALDVITQTEVLKLLRECTGTADTPALLFITHDISAAAQLCERALIIENGRQVANDNVMSILTRPDSGFSRRLVKAFNDQGLTQPHNPQTLQLAEQVC